MARQPYLWFAYRRTMERMRAVVGRGYRASPGVNGFLSRISRSPVVRR